METSAKNQYLVCLPDVSEPLPLAEAAVSRPYALDYNLPYFQSIVTQREAELCASDLTCYLTRRAHGLVKLCAEKCNRTRSQRRDRFASD